MTIFFATTLSLHSIKKDTATTGVVALQKINTISRGVDSLQKTTNTATRGVIFSKLAVRISESSFPSTHFLTELDSLQKHQAQSKLCYSITSKPATTLSLHSIKKNTATTGVVLGK